MSTNVGTIDLSLVLNSDKFKSQLKSVDAQANTASSTISSSLSKIGKAVITAFSVTAIVNFGKECLNVATETSNAWIGLNSILTGQGKSFSEAKSFINDYISDGLVPLNNAVTAYKNLAARGYSSEQIKKTMTALKNSATFGRQSTYSLGEAVQTASEGLKNENSVLVDNAGVTKNVAKMWEDYAKSIGKTTSELTQQEKIQAEVNGIVEETKFQSNDAAIYANTYSGKIAQLSQAFTTMKTAIGNVIQPIAKAFVPVITTAINAVTKLFTALSSLLSLFGLKADSVETVSSGLDGISDSADEASSSIEDVGDSTTETAKKAKNLASFDTAQVLSDSSSSSSSSGSSSSGSSTETSATSSIATDVEETSNLLNNINFQPLINAFNNLKSAAEPIITNIKDGLKWLYDNVLVPLGKWTIEDLLPAFLNLLAGALRVLNPLIEALKPIFTWFWDNFLQPIATWTGGVIISTLNGLANALSTVGNWMSNNISTVTNIEIAVLGFMGAWKCVEIMSFIAQSGGLVATLTKITTAIWACTGAKIKDKLETMYLNLLYAKDFVASIASGTAALIKQAAQWVINTARKVADTAATIASTAATTAATAATWLFNAALAVLTSPITLVVVAIGALIAAVVAIVKNWDTVSAALSTGWEWIKEKATEIFGAIGQFLSKVWEGIKSVVATVWNAISSFISTIINKIKTTITTVFNAIKTVITTIFNAIKTVVTTVWNAIKTVVVNVVTGIKEKVSTAFNAIKTVISTVMNTVKSVITNIWNGIWNTIKNVINGILGGIEGFVNGIIKGINFLLKGVSKVANAIGSLIGLDPISLELNTISLPRLAQGAYVKANTPQLAVIGDNKTQGEYVAPEDKLRALIREESGNSNEQVVQLLEGIIDILKTLGLDFNLYLDGYELNKRLEKIKNKKIFATNGG